MITAISLENFLVIDIETVSASKEFTQLSNEWKELWQEKIGRSLPADTTAAEYYPQRAGIMAEFGKIVCISIGYFRPLKSGISFRVKSLFDANEKDLLQNFIQTVNQLEAVNNRWVFAGHNIKEFDVPFICRRLLVNGIGIPPYLDFQNMKPWETNMVDTFQYWRFGDYKNFTSLRLLAASLNIPSPKDDIDGSMVGKVYWEDDDRERIANYCQKDVVTVANLLLRFKGHALLTPEQIVYVK